MIGNFQDEAYGRGSVDGVESSRRFIVMCGTDGWTSFPKKKG